MVTPDAAIILTFTDVKQFLYFRQTKFNVDGTSIVFDVGMIEPGKTPLKSTKRELLETIGHQSNERVIRL